MAVAARGCGFVVFGAGDCVGEFRRASGTSGAGFQRAGFPGSKVILFGGTPEQLGQNRIAGAVRQRFGGPHLRRRG